MNCHMPPAPDPAIDGLWLKAGFGDRQINQILGLVLLGHHPLNHRLVAAGALKRVQERVVALCVLAKKLIKVAT